MVHCWKNAFTDEKNEMLRCSTIFDFVKSARMHEPKPFLGPPKYLPQWIRGIEAFDAGPKGRGVRTCMNIKAGNVVLIEPPIAHNITVDKAIVFSCGRKENIQSHQTNTLSTHSA